MFSVDVFVMDGCVRACTKRWNVSPGTRRHWGPLMVAQWLRYCATNRKVVGSIPDCVIEIFH
jgi:hypothetical protein